MEIDEISHTIMVQDPAVFYGHLALGFPAGNPESLDGNGASRIWLKGAALASIIVAPMSVEIWLEDILVIRYSLQTSSMPFKFLNHSLTNRAHLLIGAEGRMIWCFRLYDGKCAEDFAAALGVEMQDERSTRKLMPQTSVCPSPEFAAARQSEGENLHSSVGMASNISTITPQTPPTCSRMPEPHDSYFVSEYFLDPGFADFVDKVEAIWDEVELELKDHMS